MRTQRKGPFGIGARSLSRQIALTEDRLDRRKAAVGELSSSLGARIRSGFTSPGGLLIAGSAGYLVGAWVHRPTREPRPARKQSSAPPGESMNNRGRQSAAISKALLIIKVALDLKARWAMANPGGTGPGQSR